MTREGFAMIPNWVVRDPSMSGNAKLVYIALSGRVGSNGCAWPRHQVLADELGLSVSTVKRALLQLRARGLVSWTPQIRPDNSVSSNSYRMTKSTTTPRSPLSTPPGSPVNRRPGLLRPLLDRRQDEPGGRTQTCSF